jgi:hypothetical protein
MLKKNLFQGHRLVVGLSILFLLIPTVSRAGFGISPGIVKINDALRGSSFEKTFVISRSDPEEDILIIVESEGEIGNWFQFERGTKFTYPAGEKQFPIKAKVTIPAGTSNGIYKGGVLFKGGKTEIECEGEECEGSTVAVALAALASVEITVTDKEIKSFRILGAQIKEAIEGKPLIFSLVLENTGNVKIQPGYLIVDLFDKFHRRQLGSFTISKFEGWAAVQNMGRVEAEVPFSTEAGNLWAEISVFDHQNQLVTKENVPFDVKKGESQEGIGGLPGGKIPFWLYLVLGILGGIILALIVVMFFFAKFFKKDTKREKKKKYPRYSVFFKNRLNKKFKKAKVKTKAKPRKK